jgi:hypothetical protein
LLHYVRVRRIRLSQAELCRAGQVLAARCRDAGIELPKVKERGIWRATNLYPQSLLADWEKEGPTWEVEWQQARAGRRAARDRQEGADGLPDTSDRHGEVGNRVYVNES